MTTSLLQQQRRSNKLFCFNTTKSSMNHHHHHSNTITSSIAKKSTSSKKTNYTISVCKGLMYLLLVCVMILQLLHFIIYIHDETSFYLFTLSSVSSSSSKDGWHVYIAHEPRYDLLGSFVLPTIFLYAVTNYYNTASDSSPNHWELVILPFAGSQQESILQDLVNQRDKIGKDWGSGFQDASHRVDYDPVQLNTDSYKNIGFFPTVSKNAKIRTELPWIKRETIPLPNRVNYTCAKNHQIDTTTSTMTKGDHITVGDNNCYILLTDNPLEISAYMNNNGGIDQYFTSKFCNEMRTKFLQLNHFRLQKYDIPNNSVTTVAKDGSIIDHTTTTNNNKNNIMYFNVAIHIRRGDILSPDRWIDQSVYAKVAEHICVSNTNKLNNNNSNHTDTDSNIIIKTNIHVFSSGPNRDGNWTILENLAKPTNHIKTTYEAKQGSLLSSSSITTTSDSPCANIYFHIDEVEFDSWTYMVAADALIISKSTFSYIPALIRYNNVYFPHDFWHPKLSSFYTFHAQTGEILI